MVRHFHRPGGPYVVGIDPGLTGGLAALGLDGLALAAGPMPTASKGRDKREIDAAALLDFFVFDFGYLPRLVVVERVASMPGQGVASTFSFGVGFGKVLGVLAALKISHQLVAPQAWKKAVLAGTDKSKEAAICYCGKRFPAVDLRATDRSKVPSDGIADALCLAEFARRLAVGEEAA